MQMIVSLLLNGFAVYITAYLLPGVSVDNFVTALITSVVLAVINVFIKPIIQIFSLPITLITFGLFSIVINGLLILFAAWLVPGFQVQGFLWALAFAVVLWMVNAVFHMFTGGE